MPKAAARKKGTPAQFAKAFTPVAVEIGRLSRSWNSLHENFGLIFAYIVSPGKLGIPLAVWHSTPNDRTQRDMLRAANRAWAVIDRAKAQLISIELIWLLNQADVLANKRNNALHAPLNILMDLSTFEFSVEANHFWGNPRAKNLKGKNVLLEIRAYLAQSECLDDYAFRIQQSIASSRPLPGRPFLPAGGESSVPKQ